MMARSIRSRPLAAFFVLAFGITWAVWLPEAAGVPVGAAGQLWTWVPAVAALLAAALTGGRGAVAELGSRLVRWRVGWRWYAVVGLGPAVFSLAGAAPYAMLGGSWSDAVPPALVGETPWHSYPSSCWYCSSPTALARRWPGGGSPSRGGSFGRTLWWPALSSGRSGRRGTCRSSGPRTPRSTGSRSDCFSWT